MQGEAGTGSAWEQVDLLSFAAPLVSAEPVEAEPVEPEPVAAEPDAPEPAASESVVHEPVVDERAAEQPSLDRPAAAAASVAEPLPPAIAVAPGQSLAEPEAPPGCPQRLLILDTETTGLDPQRDHCIEVGAVLFDVAHRAVLSQISFLLPCDDNPARAVNGIDPAVTRLDQPWSQALQCFEAMVAAADLVVAHNAAFDRQWFGHGHLPVISRPWLCSMEDLRWPAEKRLRSNPSVRDLALAYGVPVWAAHRALTDCLYIVQVFERCPELEQLLQAGLEPRRLYRARLSYDERHKAREAGFRWNEPISGAWSRRLSEREAALLNFPVVAVDDDPSQRRTA